MEKSTRFWNKISNKYDSQVTTRYAQTYRETITNTLNYVKPTDTVLDYGCGTGITTIELSGSVKKIIAIDTSENMINIAKKKSEEKAIKNIEFNITDIFNRKLKKESFDAVMGFNILYFIKDITHVLNHINKLLKPGGVFISATDCLGEKKTLLTAIQWVLSKAGFIPYMRHVTMSELEGIIKSCHFSIVKTRNLYKSPPNYFIVAKKEKL
jgi:ubiquinone/menaquinone biosynthesis C-methylase UbiE